MMPEHSSRRHPLGPRGTNVVLANDFLHVRADKVARARVLAVGLLGILLSLLPGFDLHPVPAALRARFHFRLNSPEAISEYAQWKLMRSLAYEWGLRGLALDALSRGGGIRS
jgi:hypothetical protein